MEQTWKNAKMQEIIKKIHKLLESKWTKKKFNNGKDLTKLASLGFEALDIRANKNSILLKMFIDFQHTYMCCGWKKEHKNIFRHKSWCLR